MKRIYPVIIEPVQDVHPYVVSIPDLDIFTEGDSLYDAVDMARDAIGLFLVDRLDNVPHPSDIADVQAPGAGWRYRDARRYRPVRLQASARSAFCKKDPDHPRLAQRTRRSRRNQFFCRTARRSRGKNRCLTGACFRFIPFSPPPASSRSRTSPPRPK